MPRKLPRHVEFWTDRHGRKRCYFRKGKGPRIALPITIGSEEFESAYIDALVGAKHVKKAEVDKNSPGTLSALIEAYFKSSAYHALRLSTKRGYTFRLEVLRVNHGHRTLSGMTPGGIITKILEPYADRPGQQQAILKMLRILIRYGQLIDMLKSDPSAGIKRPKSGDIRSWTDAELLQYENRWPIGTKQRLAYALMLFTGQRRSDAYRMDWSHIGVEGIRVVQQKTGTEVTIPLHSELKKILNAVSGRSGPILKTEYGKGFTVAGFSQFLRDAITEAGLPLECQPHGLRKAAGRRLADVHVSTQVVMAILGHRNLAEAEKIPREQT